jgi:oligoendopeptidase F
VREEGEPARRRYLGLLTRGSSRYPLELLAEAGVDLVSPETVSRVLEAFAQRVDELEQLLGEGPAPGGR